jgi:broad specificity phosphatase PhoE
VLIAVRHGRTSMNEDGVEKLRGWLPIALMVEGCEASYQTADKLARLDDVVAVYTSPLIRAIQSATPVGHKLGIELEPVEWLKDWDTGHTGQEVEETLPIIHNLIDHPDLKDGGESYNEFLDRCIPALRKHIISDEVCIAVTHNRVITLIRGLCKTGGEYPDTKLLKRKAPVEPSGFIVVSPTFEIEYAYLPDDLTEHKVGDKD